MNDICSLRLKRTLRNLSNGSGISVFVHDSFKSAASQKFKATVQQSISYCLSTYVYGVFRWLCVFHCLTFSCDEKYCWCRSCCL